MDLKAQFRGLARFMSLMPSAASNDSTTNACLVACNHLIVWTFGAAFLFVATSAFAQKQAEAAGETLVSPDMASGSFALARPVNGRILAAAYAGKLLNRRSCCPTERALTDLDQELHVNGPERLATLRSMWAPDSKRFAFNYSPVHALAYGLSNRRRFYQLRRRRRGASSIPCESTAATFAPLR